MATTAWNGDGIAILDAHQHFWDPVSNPIPWLREQPPIPFRYGDYAALRRPYLPPDYRADAAVLPIVGTVHVEAEWDPRDPLGETRWVEGVAARHGLPCAMVAQARLDREDAAEVLRAQAASPLVRGIRHKPRAAARREDARRGEPGSMDCPRWREGYALLARHGLHFELQAPWWHLDAAAELARDFPATTIVLNHAGLPADRGEDGLAAWRRAMERLAAAPNVLAKISGIGVPGIPWPRAGNARIVRDAIAIFGAARCMFASNFPVDGLVGGLGEIFAGFEEATRGMEPAARRALFRDNALAAYRIDPRALRPRGGAGSGGDQAAPAGTGFTPR